MVQIVTPRSKLYIRIIKNVLSTLYGVAQKIYDYKPDIFLPYEL